MPAYTILWKHGRKETLKGRTFTAAFSKQYDPNALMAMDTYVDAAEAVEWVYDAKLRSWSKVDANDHQRRAEAHVAALIEEAKRELQEKVYHDRRAKVPGSLPYVAHVFKQLGSLGVRAKTRLVRSFDQDNNLSERRRTTLTLSGATVSRKELTRLVAQQFEQAMEAQHG